MTLIFRRSLVALSIAAISSAGLLAGCEQRTTTETPDGTSSTTSTTSVGTVNPAPDATATVKSTAKDVGKMADDGMITAKVKTALLADPDVKGLKIDVDTKNGVVTLTGTVEKSASLDRAVTIARNTEGVKSVENQLVVKSA